MTEQLGITGTALATFRLLQPVLSAIWDTYLQSEELYVTDSKSVTESYRSGIMDKIFDSSGTNYGVSGNIPTGKYKYGNFGCCTDTLDILFESEKFNCQRGQNVLRRGYSGEYSYVTCQRGDMSREADIAQMIYDTIYQRQRSSNVFCKSDSFTKLPLILVVDVDSLLHHNDTVRDKSGKESRQEFDKTLRDIYKKGHWLDGKVKEDLVLKENDISRNYKLAAAVYRQRTHFVTRFKEGDCYYDCDGFNPLTKGYAKVDEHVGFPYFTKGPTYESLTTIHILFYVLQ
jgi:hypothetical protein